MVFTKPRELLYLYLTTLFVTLLIVADLIGGKTIMISNYSFHFANFTLKPIFSAGLLPFAFTFVITDIVNEFFGKEGAKRLTFIGLFSSILTMIILLIAIKLPTYENSFVSALSFNNVFAISARIFIASIITYIISQLIDIYAFHYLRKITGDKMIWLRMTGSTLISQVFDSFIVCIIAYIGLMTWSDILSIAFNNYLIKILIAIILTPLCYYLHDLIKKNTHQYGL